MGISQQFTWKIMPETDDDFLVYDDDADEDISIDRRSVSAAIKAHLEYINPEGRLLHACVNNFGWRKVDGYKLLNGEDLANILGKLLPGCSCSGKVWLTATGFKVQNYHHDSCTGKEWYEVKVTEPEETGEEVKSE